MHLDKFQHIALNAHSPLWPSKPSEAKRGNNIANEIDLYNNEVINQEGQHTSK